MTINFNEIPKKDFIKIEFNEEEFKWLQNMLGRFNVKVETFLITKDDPTLILDKKVLIEYISNEIETHLDPMNARGYKEKLKKYKDRYEWFKNIPPFSPLAKEPRKKFSEYYRYAQIPKTLFYKGHFDKDNK